MSCGFRATHHDESCFGWRFALGGMHPDATTDLGNEGTEWMVDDPDHKDSCRGIRISCDHARTHDWRTHAGMIL